MPIDRDSVVKALMRRRSELIAYAWIAVGDADLAEDVFQDVSVLAIRKCDEINDQDHLTGWLYTAIRLRSLEVRRQRAKGSLLVSEQVLEAIQSNQAQTPPQADSDRMAALRECIDLIQGVPRRVLEMRYRQNLKPAQIAKETDKNIQTIYKSLTRAHSALRDCVDERLSIREASA